jgi:hypothetical protein
MMKLLILVGCVGGCAFLIAPFGGFVALGVATVGGYLVGGMK